ncbi:MAG: Zn-dependent exopeptidase M28 [Treponema sp.]|jgi:hypothetical protein|nr:Zn-dependent exopeptidase M28 [Treponema sp.]
MIPIDENNWKKQSPYDRFDSFIALKTDRYNTLLLTIEKSGLNTTVISVAGNRHLFIFPNGQKIRSAGNTFPFAGQNPYVLVAHYDRVEGSPGANDNSIAVFHLLRAALIFAEQNIDNWIIIFTDKEELVSGENFEAQGSFTLAKKLKTWGLEKARIFNFDACGTGNTFILSTITDSILKNNDRPNINKLKENIRVLRNRALETVNKLRFERVLLAPTPFCDDMGFLRAGFVAQTITMLPEEEASKFEVVLREYPEFSNLLISGEIKKSNSLQFFPQTWKNLNTPADTFALLTPQFFEQTISFIVELCK